MSREIVVHYNSENFVVWDLQQSAYLYQHGFYGKPIGARKVSPDKINLPIHLSYFETVYLKEKKMINVEHNQSELSLSKIKEIAVANYENFELRYIFYKYFRELNYVVRPGLKFGADFIIYRKGPGIDHSMAVLHIAERESKLSAIEIVRSSRLAGSVKKNYIIGYLDANENVKFLRLNRVKI